MMQLVLPKIKKKPAKVQNKTKKSGKKKKTKPWKALIRTDYLSRIYKVDQFQKLVLQASKQIKHLQETLKFDALAFTGTSGAALAYPVSAQLGIPLICVRKSTESNHYGQKVEGCTNARKYLIVDDFLETGKTIRAIKEAIKNFPSLAEAEAVGIFLYDFSGTTSEFEKLPIIKLLFD